MYCHWFPSFRAFDPALIGVDFSGLNPPSGTSETDSVIEGAIIPALVTLLGDKEARRSSVNKLLTIAENNNGRRRLVDAGALVPLGALVNGFDLECRDRAAEIISNISACEELAPSLVDAGAILPLVSLLNSDSASCKISATYAMANLLGAADDSIAAAIVALGAIKPLVRLLHDSELSCRRFASCAVFNLSASEGDFGTQLLDHGVLETMLTMLKAGSDTECNKNAAGTIGNLATTAELRQRIVEECGAASLTSLLNKA
jgi:hypothetical protein